MNKQKETESWQDHCQSKILSPDDLAAKALSLRLQGKSIATLNGSFDLLHAGHMYMIYEASRVADVLLVLVNTDVSIKAYKGLKRPIIPLQYRLEMLAAIEFIDYLTWFEETDPRLILSIIKPDVHVNGKEYGENCIEAEVVKQSGRLHLVDRIPSLATSQIIETICHQNEKK